MNKFTTFAMLICAFVATVNCVGYGPVVERVQGASISIAGSSVANSPAKIITGPIPAVQPVWGGLSHGAVGPVVIAPRRAHLEPSLVRVGHGNAYGARVVAPAVTATVINPGPITYKAYVSPPEYSRVVLPVRANPAVAKLWVPAQKAYGGHGARSLSHGAAY